MSRYNRRNFLKSCLGTAGAMALVPLFPATGRAAERDRTKSDPQAQLPNIVFILADIWEGGHHEPFLARWPGRIEPGTRCGRILCLTDLLATCAEILGAPLPPEAGEDSFLPLLLNRPARGPVWEVVVHHSIDGMFAIRQGRWKFVDGVGSGGWSGKGDGLPGQLYDVETDPREQHNLYLGPEHQSVVHRLRHLLEECKTRGRTRP